MSGQSEGKSNQPEPLEPEIQEDPRDILIKELHKLLEKTSNHLVASAAANAEECGKLKKKLASNSSCLLPKYL